MNEHCSNPACRQKSRSLFLGLGRSPRGLVRRKLWYCSRQCHLQHLAAGLIEVKRKGWKKTARRLQLGLLLLKNGLLSRDQLRAALEIQSNSGRRLGEILVDSGFIRERDLQNALAVQAGAAPVNLEENQVFKCRELFPFALVAEFSFVCFARDDEAKNLSLAVSEIETIPFLTQFVSEALPGYTVKFFFEDGKKIEAILRHNFPLELAEHRATVLTSESQRAEITEAVVLRFMEFLQDTSVQDIQLDSLDRSLWIRGKLGKLHIEVYFTPE